MAKSTKGKSGKDAIDLAQQNEDFAKILIFIRNVRNNHEMQPDYARVNAASDAEDALERALGKRMEQVYETKTWKNS